MKKILLMISIFVSIFIPTNIYAAEIIDAEISGTNESTTGEELTLNFKVSFSDLEKGADKTLGIWFARFELVFDDEFLIVSDISSPDFKSYIYKENEKYYILSEVIENNSSQNNCVNGILYCDDYLVTVKFYIKNTEQTNTTIKMKEVEVNLLDMTDSNKTYTTDDLITINSDIEKSYELKIKKGTIETETEPTDITTETSPVIKNQKNITNKETENINASSAFIKELKIDNYDIDFNKNKTNYNLTIEENINELDINVTLENENATYKIFGADDLKNNNNEVVIEVTAEDNTKITYVIKIKYESIKENKANEEKIDINHYINKIFTKENLFYGGIAIGIIIIIILIILLINKKENKKIDKLLGEL